MRSWTARSLSSALTSFGVAVRTGRSVACSGIIRSWKVTAGPGRARVLSQCPRSSRSVSKVAMKVNWREHEKRQCDKCPSSSLGCLSDCVCLRLCLSCMCVCACVCMAVSVPGSGSVQTPDRVQVDLDGNAAKRTCREVRRTPECPALCIYSPLLLLLSAGCTYLDLRFSCSLAGANTLSLCYFCRAGAKMDRRHSRAEAGFFQT